MKLEFSFMQNLFKFCGTYGNALFFGSEFFENEKQKIKIFIDTVGWEGKITLTPL